MGLQDSNNDLLLIGFAVSEMELEETTFCNGEKVLALHLLALELYIPSYTTAQTTGHAVTLPDDFHSLTMNCDAILTCGLDHLQLDCSMRP